MDSKHGSQQCVRMSEQGEIADLAVLFSVKGYSINMDQVMAKYWCNVDIQQIIITVLAADFCFIAQTGVCREKLFVS